MNDTAGPAHARGRRHPVFVGVVAWACAGLLSACGSSVGAEDVDNAAAVPTSPSADGAHGAQAAVGATEPIADEASLHPMVPTQEELAGVMGDGWNDRGEANLGGADDTVDNVTPRQCHQFFSTLHEQTPTKEFAYDREYRRQEGLSEELLFIVLTSYPQPQMGVPRVDHIKEKFGDCGHFTRDGISWEGETLDLPHRGDGAAGLVLSRFDPVAGERYQAQIFVSLGYALLQVSYSSSEKLRDDELLALTDLVIRKVEAGGSS